MVAPQLPDAVLVPLVVPVNVPPAAGITVMPPQPPGSVVGGTVVVLEVVVTVVLTVVLVVGTPVELVVLVLVVEVAVDVLVVELVVTLLEVLVLDVTLVEVVVVVGTAGGTMRRPKAPLLPPYPSTVMKYVCPAVTVGVSRDPCEGLFASPVVHPLVSSLHANSVPVPHAPPRRYSTVSKSVALPHVSIVAVPEAEGVHWNTCSGDVAVLALQLPLCVLPPLVTPVTTPPLGGRMVTLSHAVPKLAV